MRKNFLEYPVEIVEDVFGESSSALANMIKSVTGVQSPRVMIVADANVVHHTEGLGAKIGRYMTTRGLELAGTPVILSGGERIKNDNLASVRTVARAALGARLGNGACMLAIGGGALLDVAGFAAAMVRGGVRLVRVPTTVAAMTDAAFADYAAVNTDECKDALRIPSSPSGVIVDPLFAKTVLDGVWRAGISEAVRAATVFDAAFLRRLGEAASAYHKRDYDVMKSVVAECLAIRKKNGPTAFATWSAERLEVLSSYKLPHGYAVGIGICIDTAYAVDRGLMSGKDRSLVLGILNESGASDGFRHSRYLLDNPGEIISGLDVWALANGPEITLPKKIGKSVSTADIDREALAGILHSCLESAPLPSDNKTTKKEKTMKKYVCKICGWVYDPAANNGIAFEDLPSDWTCPTCGVGKDQFEEA